MQWAPWTKISVSREVERTIASISSRVSSRASTTRAKPSSSASFAPAGEWTAIWVEAWSGISGANRRTSAATPQSWTIIASTPASTAVRIQAFRASSSCWKTTMFSAWWILTPQRWA